MRADVAGGLDPLTRDITALDEFTGVEAPVKSTGRKIPIASAGVTQA
ncbi:hypothetical protein [Streptomyces sp. NPDC017993]